MGDLKRTMILPTYVCFIYDQPHFVLVYFFQTLINKSI